MGLKMPKYSTDRLPVLYSKLMDFLYIQIESELEFHPQPPIYCNIETGILRVKYFRTYLSSVQVKNKNVLIYYTYASMYLYSTVPRQRVY